MSSSVDLTENPSTSKKTEIGNIFPIAKLNGRNVFFKWKDISFSASLELLTGLAIGVFAVAAVAAYNYYTQDLIEYLENQANNGYFPGITQWQMSSYYGHSKRSLSASEGRELYNKINKLNLNLAEKAVANNGYKDQIALSACKTRHAARLFIRELAPEAYQNDAEYRDTLVYGCKTGLTCNQIWDKYKGDPDKIISAAGRPNSDVNLFVQLMPESLYCYMSQHTRRSFINLAVNPLQTIHELNHPPFIMNYLKGL
jgi:hypothetical protein